MSFQGSVANTSVESLKVSLDTFQNLRVGPVHPVIDDVVSVGALPPIPRPIAAQLTFALSLPNPSVRDYLGFTLNQSFSTEFINTGSIEGQNLFTATLINDSFVFELLNLDLESFDSFSGGRRNILKIIPASTTLNNPVVEYEPSTPIFIDIRNDFPLTLRNLKARILRNDLTPITVRGFSVASLLIKDKSENL